jgi:hypothetical protein
MVLTEIRSQLFAFMLRKFALPTSHFLTRINIFVTIIPCSYRSLFSQADTSLQFPQKGTFAGVFLLTRNNQAQFVSGFSVPGTGSQGDGDHGFEADLQRVAVVSGGLGPAFGSAGSDAIVSGKVEVNNQGNDQSSAQSNDDNGGNQGPVEVKLKGAAAGVSYAVEFCRFGLGPSDCLSVGKLSTDMSGNADAEFAFPMTGTFDGVFVLTRSINGQNQNEFVTGFQR